MNAPDPTRVLRVEPLTRAAFAPFGDVIDTEAARAVYPINAGTAMRFHDLADIDTQTNGGRAVVSLFRAQPRVLPFEVRLIERHPLGSQAFIPLSDAPYLIVMSESPEQRPRAFRAGPGQGVNYRRGAWHHALIALERVSDFLVIDRAGPGENCDEVAMEPAWYLLSATP